MGTKQIFFTLIYLLLIFSVSCSRYESHSKVKIIVSSLSSPNNEDLILSGLSEDSEFFTTLLKGNQTNDTIEIPVGAWSFYGFYWEQNTSYCAYRTAEIQGASQSIEIEFSRENCLKSNFAGSEFISNNTSSIMPIDIIPCKPNEMTPASFSINNITELNDYCDFDYDLGSIKVAFPSVIMSPSSAPNINWGKSLSECVIVDGESETKYFPSIGNASTSLFYSRVQFFSDANCEEELGRVELDRIFWSTENLSSYFLIEDNESGITYNSVILKVEIEEEEQEIPVEEATSNINSVCTSNSDCTSNLCDTEYDEHGVETGELICTKSSFFSYCETNDDCYSGICNEKNSLCAGKTMAEECSDDSECLSGTCYGLSCIDEVCTPGACGQGSFFTYCETSADCLIGNCKSAGTSSSFDRNQKKIPYEDNYCSIGEYKEECAAHTDCNTGLCIDSRCHGTIANAFCTEDIDCLSNSCVENSCATSGLSMGCESDADCNEGYCYQGICRFFPAYAYCQADVQCETGKCSGSLCVYRSVNDSCDSDDVCFSSNCSNGVCANTLISDGPCQSNSECPAEHTCITGSCIEDSAFDIPLCGDGLLNGTESDVDCGGICSFVSPAYQCATDQDCTVDTDCQSSTCDNDSGRCIDQSIKFTGGQYIYFNNTDAAAAGVRTENEPTIDDDEGVKSFTINIWIKTGTDANQYILNQRESGADYSIGQYMLTIQSTQLCFINYFFNGTPNFLMACTLLSGPGYDYADGNWHMISVTKETPVNQETTTTVKLYVDGVEKAESTADILYPVSNYNKVYVGANVRDRNSYFAGLIDNLTFWKTSLSSTDILTLYNSGKAINPLVNVPNYMKADFVTHHYNVNLDEILNTITPTLYNHDALYDASLGQSIDGLGTPAPGISYESNGVSDKYLHVKLQGQCPKKMTESSLELDTGLDWADLNFTSVSGHVDFLDRKNGSKTILFAFNNMNAEEEEVIIQGINGQDFYKSVIVENQHYNSNHHFITVDSLLDNGDNCTLREAIENWSTPGAENNNDCTLGVAQGEASLTNIHFSPTDEKENIYTMNHSTYEIECDAGSSCTNLKILGCGKTKTTIHGAGVRRHFINNATTTFQSLKLTDGLSDDGLGGAIYNEGQLTLRGVDILNTQANGINGGHHTYGGGNGGGACKGGAIYNDSSAILFIKANVSFSSNACYGGNGGNGNSSECTGSLLGAGDCPNGSGGEHYDGGGGRGGANLSGHGQSGGDGDFGGGGGGAGSAHGTSNIVFGGSGGFRAGDGGDSSMNSGGGGGAGGAFGGAIFNDEDAVIYILQDDPPTFLSNSVVTGSGGTGGVNGDTPGLNKIENIFNLGGDIKILELGSTPANEATPYNYSVYNPGQNEYILDYRCSDEQTCACANGTCESVELLSE